MPTTPRFLQGAHPFEGSGLDKRAQTHPALAYVVPPGVTARPLYVRGGNSSGELVGAVLMRDGAPMRCFPIGARSDAHVPLRVVEDVLSGSRIELHRAAAEGVAGTVVVDLGLVEV